MQQDSQIDLNLSGLPDHTRGFVEDVVVEVAKGVPTERSLNWLRSKGELRLDTFFQALGRRHEVWEDKKVDPSQVFYEMMEMKSLALSPYLRGVELLELSLPFLFDEYQLRERIVSHMQRKLLDMYGRSPQLARDIVDLSIVGGHGTRSGSLINIMSHGLRPTDYQKDQGLASLTGTFDWNGNNFNRRATSLTLWWNDRDVTRYSHRPAVNIAELNGWMKSYRKEWDKPGLHPTRKFLLGKVKEMSDFLGKKDKTEVERDTETLLRADFPVVIFADDMSLSRHNTHRVDSDIQDEFAVDGGVQPDDIPVILVPEKNIRQVKQYGLKYQWYGRVGNITEYSDLKDYEV
jgi:hypothetical protein